MFDIVINNANVADPTASRLYHANIGIVGGKIAAITNEKLAGDSIIDAKGYIAAPGFIDVHSHVDGHTHCGSLSLLQGITTAIGGNCGLSAVDIGEWMNEQDKKGFFINQVQLFGHSMSLREHLGLSPYDKATDEQIDKMVQLTRQALEQGAAGVSFGLDYSPAITTKEFHAVGEVAAEYGRIVAVDGRMKHLKDLYSLCEIVVFARETGARTLVSHFVYQYGNEVMEEALELVECCRGKGIDIFIDSGLYKDWSSFVGAALFDEDHLICNGCEFENLYICTGQYKGMRMNETLYGELRAHHPQESVVCLSGDEESVYLALKQSYAVPSTDAGEYRPGEGHPQAAGSFPRFFQKMVRERKDLTLLEAVKKSTLIPAEILGLTDKGRLGVGCDADLVIFDLDTIEDKANFCGFGSPDTPPVGIEAVIVNGELAAQNGRIINGCAGKVIRF